MFNTICSQRPPVKISTHPNWIYRFQKVLFSLRPGEDGGGWGLCKASLGFGAQLQQSVAVLAR